MKKSPKIIRFLLIGIVNTSSTLIIIILLTKLGVNLLVANATGYCIGTIISFLSNCKYTFKTERNKERFYKFILSNFISWVINIIAINISIYIFKVEAITAQLIGMSTYTISSFILNDKWVMK